MPNDLNEKLGEVFAAKWQAENHPHYAEMLDKFLFHMTDASHDIRQIADLFQHSDAADCATFGILLAPSFFSYHLPHLVAAGQLYDFVPEIFPEQRGIRYYPVVFRKNASIAARCAPTPLTWRPTLATERFWLPRTINGITS